MESGSRSSLSFVVPVFNEEGNVSALHEEITRVATALGRPYEILFVNDGSVDATCERLLALAADDPHLRIVDLDGNFGEAAGLSAGFSVARGQFIVTMDGDGQNDPADVPRLLSRLEHQGLDVVSGRRAQREEAFVTRVLPSWIANSLIARATGVPVHDCGCGLKVYRRHVVQGAQLPKGMNRFLPAILGVDRRRVAEEVVNDRCRGSGASHYGLWRVAVVFRDLPSLPLLVRRPLPGRRTLRSLTAATVVLTALAAVAAAAAVLHPLLLLLAVAAALGAAAAGAARHNTTRFLAAGRKGVFRVRSVLDGNAAAQHRDRGRRLLGQEPAPDLQPAAGGARR
jgi:hypothetical protein